MASFDVRSIVLILLSIALIVGAGYLINPNMFGSRALSTDGFATMGTDQNYVRPAGQADISGVMQQVANLANAYSLGGDKKKEKENGKEGLKDMSGEGFANLEDVTGPAAFDNAQGPAGCYPRDQLTPSELLPKDPNSVWAQQNPMGTGSLKGKNFLSAGALIGVNTVGQSLRNANYQLRSEPPNPQVPISVFYNSTIEPDTNHRDLEIN